VASKGITWAWRSGVMANARTGARKRTLAFIPPV
jgi:hypothetical protein